MDTGEIPKIPDILAAKPSGERSMENRARPGQPRSVGKRNFPRERRDEDDSTPEERLVDIVL